jgi:hypothetical protein
MHLGRAFATAVRNSPRQARSVAVFPQMQTEPVNRNCLTSPQLVGAASDTTSQAPADADVADVAKAIVKWWTGPSGSFRSVRTSIPHKTVQRSSTESQIVFVPRCTATSVCQIY